MSNLFYVVIHVLKFTTETYIHIHRDLVVLSSRSAEWS